MEKKVKLQRVKNIFNIKTATFKSITILGIIVYFIIIFGMTLKRFNTTDTIPQLKPINTEALKKLGSFTVHVNIGLFIKNFSVFDVNKNTYIVDSIVWFEFNSDEITLDIIEKFSFDNGKILYKSPADIKIDKDKVFAKYNVTFELKTDLNFHRFPFEDHRLPIIISNDFVTPDELVFVVDATSFRIRENIAPAGWKFHDTHVDSGYLPILLNQQDESKKAENPKALFVLNFIKASARKTLVIFIPLFAVVFLSLIAFIMNTTNTVGKFTVATTAMTTLLGYRFVIEQIMPQVGYFTTTDIIYLFLLIFIFANFFIQLLMTRYQMASSSIASLSENKSELLKILDNKLELWGSCFFLIMTFLLAAITSYILLS